MDEEPRSSRSGGPVGDDVVSGAGEQKSRRSKRKQLPLWQETILLLGVAKDDLRQTDFMFDTPQFVEGVSDYGSWYIFA